MKALSSMATRRMLTKLLDSYPSGRVELEATGGIAAARRVREGEAVDLVILASGAIAKLEAEGLLLADGTAAVARSAIAVAVPANAPSPDIGDAEAVRAALLRAPSVSYSTGPSGDHLQALWRDWGIEEAMAAKARQAPPGVSVASVIATGEAHLGVQQLSELMDAPGVKIVGLLPAGVQKETVFVGAIASACHEPEAAREVLAYLASPGTAAVKRRFGMEPAD